MYRLSDRNKPYLLLMAVAMLTSAAARAQAVAAETTTQDQTPTITVNSTLVVVPALIKTKSGEVVFTLKAGDFTLTDNGVPQKLTLEDDTDQQPLALVIAVETGAAGAEHLPDYRGLSPLLDALIGSVPHKIALVGFDSTPTLLHGFTPNTSFIEKSLEDLDPGDNRAATLDALAFSVELLRKQPSSYRRAILLLSETLDQGSHTRLDDALHAISDTNTAIYSMSFASTGSQIHDEAAKLSSDEPGPEHGCFSREIQYDEDDNPIPPKESRATQNFDCFAELLPPLRLAKIAQIAARNAMRRNISASVAQLTGGEHYKFGDAKHLQKDLLTLSNHIPNRYVLSFHPQSPLPGFHAIKLTVPDYAGLTVQARNGYWVDAAP